MKETPLLNKGGIMPLLRNVKEVISLPRIVIQMQGGTDCYQSYENFTKQHPRYKLIRNKSIGVALMVLPDTFEETIAGKKRSNLRYKRNYAKKHGYRFSKIEPSKHIDEILKINKSMIERQGKPMPEHYLNIDVLRKYYKDKPLINGVIDSDNEVKAYLNWHICGEVCIIDRLLGNGDDLKYGIMYFIVSETVRDLIEKRNIGGVPVYFMYDMWFGALQGLRKFKADLGFEPYRVIWKWKQTN